MALAGDCDRRHSAAVWRQLPHRAAPLVPMARRAASKCRNATGRDLGAGAADHSPPRCGAHRLLGRGDQPRVDGAARGNARAARDLGVGWVCGTARRAEPAALANSGETAMMFTSQALRTASIGGSTRTPLARVAFTIAFAAVVAFALLA